MYNQLKQEYKENITHVIEKLTLIYNEKLSPKQYQLIVSMIWILEDVFKKLE